MEILNKCALATLLLVSVGEYLRLRNVHKKLKIFQNHNKTLQLVQDDVKCFKHDFDNLIATIGGYVISDDMTGLRKYYYQLENDCKSVNTLCTLSPEIINENGVYNLLIEKFEKAEELDVKINLEIFLNLQELNIPIYQFTRILGILIDNAIESASQTDEKVVNIYLKNENWNNRQLVIVENTYNNKEVDIDKIFEKNFTSKETHSGLGLFKVRQIIKRNKNLNLFTSKNAFYFKQQLEIYDK